VKALLLIPIMLTAILSARSQTLHPGSYGGTNASSVGIILMAETNGTIHAAVGIVNQITGSLNAFGAGTAATKPNGRVFAKLSGRGRLRGHVSEDGRSIRGRVLMLNAQRDRIWFVRRFELFLVEETAATADAAIR
jgi:hypothetical protein